MVVSIRLIRRIRHLDTRSLDRNAYEYPYVGTSKC